MSKICNNSKKQRFTLTFDEFFKIGMKAFFSEFGFEVQTEIELFKLPKRLDVLLIKKVADTLPEEFALLTYLEQYNLISYKSPSDPIREKDIRDAIIYLNGYINMTKGANYKNTTMSIFCNRKPTTFLKENKKNIVVQASGYWRIDYGLFTIHLLNLNQTEFSSLESLFLKDFADVAALKVAYKTLQEKIENVTNLKIVDMVQQFIYYRAYGLDTSLLKEFEMPNTAEIDITDIVKPHYEKGLEQGLERGLEQGIEQGRQEGQQEGAYRERVETAKRLKKLNVETKIICESTGLSEQEVAKLLQEK